MLATDRFEPGAVRKEGGSWCNELSFTVLPKLSNPVGPHVGYWSSSWACSQVMCDPDKPPGQLFCGYFYLIMLSPVRYVAMWLDVPSLSMYAHNVTNIYKPANYVAGLI